VSRVPLPRIGDYVIISFCHPEPGPEFISGSSISGSPKSLDLLDAEPILNQVQHKVQKHDISLHTLITTRSLGGEGGVRGGR